MKICSAPLLALFIFCVDGTHSLTWAQSDKPVTVRVAADGTGDFDSIAKALAKVPDGSTIRVAKGTWTVTREPLEVTRPVTIEGEGWTETRIVSTSEGGERPSPKLLEELSRIAKELDDDTNAKLQTAFQKVYGAAPPVTIRGAKAVAVRNLAIVRTAPVRKGSFTNDVAVDVVDSEVLFEDCAILESPGNGLDARGNSHVQIKKCLIANAWGKGIVVAVSESGSFALTDSEIRNNVYSGITIGSLSRSILVQRCQIHGTGWHGIRYDGSSPTIQNNVFHQTAVAGIYASGKTAATVKNNLFLQSGISCWFENKDTIEANTFVGDRDTDKKGGITQGIQILGASQPVVRRNLFVTCQDAVYAGDIQSKGETSKSVGELTLVENAFWNNDRNLARHDPGTPAKKAFPLPEGNIEQQPKFVDGSSPPFRLDPESPLAKTGIGARDFVSTESRWPVQPAEERSITAIAERLTQTGGQK